VGDKRIVELLLIHGADPNAKVRGDWTALIGASCGDWHSHRDLKATVELLLAHGADVNAKTKGGDTPLSFATRAINKEVAELLRQHGAE